MESKDRLLGEYEKEIEVLTSVENIILYGKTQLAYLMRQILCDFGIRGRIHIFDKKYNAESCLREMYYSKKSCIVICGLSKKTRESMLSDIQESASEYIESEKCFDIFALYYVWSVSFRKRKVDADLFAKTITRVRDEEDIVLNIDCINTTYCNLNCKECSNGMQIRKDKKNLDSKSVISDVERITSIMPIAYLNFQGGEPLVGKNLSDIIYGISENSQVAFMTLATNGCVVPDEKTLEAISKAGVIIRISDYGELSDKKEALINSAKSYRIPCDIYERAISWVVYGEYRKHNRLTEENKRIAQTCFFGCKDLMMYDGYLYCCCRTLFGNALGRCDKEIELNRVKLDDMSKEALASVVNGEKLFFMCDYCDWPMNTVTPAEQI